MAPSPTVDQATYWNDEGGRRWVANIERVERMLQPLSQRLLEAAAASPGERVIDVGCGGGVTSAALAQAVGAQGAVLGLDVSAVILDVARQRYGNVANLKFVLGDAANMPLSSKAYDLIASRFGVMFFPDPTAAFHHLRAALAPRGRLVFICWRALEQNPWMAIPTQAAFEVLPRPEPPAPHAPGPFAFADAERLRGLLESAGFSAIEITAVDESVALGSLDEAVQQMIRMGPAAAAFTAADKATQNEVVAAVERGLAPFVSAGRIRLQSATWLVQALTA
ncbi:MAG: class I SAM-dependent methyltransferase [Gammaproteobacteria bacterium]|nr:class I SAM-dependent methyltransferase [Gammaproteobacteria bacterium]